MLRTTSSAVPRLMPEGIMRCSLTYRNIIYGTECCQLYRGAGKGAYPISISELAPSLLYDKEKQKAMPIGRRWQWRESWYRVLSGICASTVAFKRMLARHTRERNPIPAANSIVPGKFWRGNYSTAYIK